MSEKFKIWCFYTSTVLGFVFLQCRIQGMKLPINNEFPWTVFILFILFAPALIIMTILLYVLFDIYLFTVIKNYFKKKQIKNDSIKIVSHSDVERGVDEALSDEKTN